jgi:hypothetical protein
MQRQMIYDVRKFAKVVTSDCGRGLLKKVYLIAGLRGAAVSLLIFSNLIFNPSADPEIPSLAAARDGLDTDPSLSANAASDRKRRRRISISRQRWLAAYGAFCVMRTSIDSVTATPTISPVASLMRCEGPLKKIFWGSRGHRAY